MKTRINIQCDSTGTVQAVIDDAKNPATVKRVLDSLPITMTAQLWGDEIYAEIPVSAGEENSQVEVDIGDLAYWPPGRSLCIFFGRTPASRGDQPAAASPVNVIGMVTDDPKAFSAVRNGEKITIDRA